MHITSKDNEKIKHLKKLNQKKHRDEAGEFVVENLKIISDALRSGIVFESLFVTETFLQSQAERLPDILKRAGDYIVINEQVNKYFSSLETPSGICAVYKIKKRDIDFSNKIIYLNNVSDPGNLGTILRSALAFGFKNIVLDEHCVDLYNPKTIQAAKDAIFKLNIGNDNGLEILKKIKPRMPIISTRMEDARDVREFKAYDKYCLVLGSEAHGVSQEIQKMTDEFIKINISPDMESLNVAVASGIFFFSLNKK